MNSVCRRTSVLLGFCFATFGCDLLTSPSPPSDCRSYDIALERPADGETVSGLVDFSCRVDPEALCDKQEFWLSVFHAPGKARIIGKTTDLKNPSPLKASWDSKTLSNGIYEFRCEVATRDTPTTLTIAAARAFRLTVQN